MSANTCSVGQKSRKKKEKIMQHVFVSRDEICEKKYAGAIRNVHQT